MMKGIATALSLATLLVSLNMVYPTTMLITDVNRETDVVTMETATGYEYQFTGCIDYCEGDFVSVLMFTNGTSVITDDVILAHRYAGWIMEEGRIR